MLLQLYQNLQLENKSLEAFLTNKGKWLFLVQSMLQS